MVSTLHGSSRFGDSTGSDKEIAFDGAGLLLGYPKTSNGVTLKDKLFSLEPQRHLLSVAPTRSGKGVALIIPNLLTYRGSAIVIDPKGENAWITAKSRRDDLGHKTIILDPWGEVNRRYGDLAGKKETVARFNPLSILNPESEHYADDIAYLADALIINQGKDPHWDDSARELVAGLMAYLVEHPQTRAGASLSGVRLLLTLPVARIQMIAQEAVTFGPDSVAARKLGRFAIDSRETASIISTALTQTAFLDSVTLAKNLEVSDFSFEELVTGFATIYLVLPVDKLQTYGRWLRLLLSIGIRTVARNIQPLPLPVLFMLDEFGTIGKLSAVSQAYGLMAGLQMVLWAFVQDLVQLKRDYPDEWETFIGNSQAVTFFNIMDQFTTKHLSELLGTTTVEWLTTTTQKKREATFFGDPNYQTTEDQQFARALLQPAEIRFTDPDVGFIISRYLPNLFEIIPYYKEDFLLERARVDPHFPEMQAAKDKLAAEKAFPDVETANAVLEQQGYQISRGWFGTKVKVLAPLGQEKTFADDAAFLQWARLGDRS